jgi:bifunctional lysine-specific demethylase and histidyl-hydroxylase NO66
MEASKDRHHHPRRPSEPVGGEEGRGESRASKKRAKKKSKNNNAVAPRGPPPSSGDDGHGAPGYDKKKKTTKRRPLPSHPEGLAPSSRNQVDSGGRRDGPNRTASSAPLTSSRIISDHRKKRPREAERRRSYVDPDGDESLEENVDDAELFGVDAGKKVQFLPREEDNNQHDPVDDDGRSNNSNVPVAASPTVPSKRRATGPRATVPPPSVTRITQLLSLPSDDPSALDAAADPTNVESTSAANADTAASSLSSSAMPTVTSWLSQRTTEQRASAVLNFILQPSSITTDEFYATYWEKKPLLVQSSDASLSSSSSHTGRFQGLMGLAAIQDMTKSKQQQPIYYSRDLNVTKYEKVDGTYRRRTLDPAHPTASHQPALSPEDVIAASAHDPDRFYVPVDHHQLWDELYRKLGCTIRLLCPHKHFQNVHAILSLLEHEFGNMVGANAYLTPPNGAQGFAPHYDDIEAFCCQLEGQKRWKVYAPLHKAARLPRTSSRDYTPSDLREVEPVMDVVLSPGDVLYMPRGWIHQACTLPETSVSPDGHGHSLHLTISTMQQWAWVDLMENLMSDALEVLSRSDRTTLLRDGLPRNFVSYMGVMHDSSDEAMPESLKKRPYEAQEEDADELARLAGLQASREEFRHEAKRRIARVAQEAMSLLDASCDQMAKRFLSDRLPPAGLVRDADLNLQPDTLCRLARPGIARLVLEDGKAVLYHCADNLLVFHEHPLSPLEFEMDDAPAIEQLLTTVEPRWISVQDLYHDGVDDKLSVAQSLYDEGILAVR